MLLRRCFSLFKRSTSQLSTRAFTTNAGSSEVYQSRPRRALLYMPGDDMKKITKAASLDVDIAVLDCEDAVAGSRKVIARDMICNALNTLQFGRTERGVRTNSVSSGLIEGDLKSVLTNDTVPDIVMIPKLDTVSEAEFLNSVCRRYSKEPVPIIFQTESAVGLVNLQDILKYLKTASHLIPVAVVFGADDFVSDIRASRDIESVVYARQKVVTYARAFGIQPIDRVHIEFKELESLRLESVNGFQLGFTGKQCIHPSQVPVIQEAFKPTKAQVEYAKALIDSFTEHQDLGKGAFTFQGKMIDRPTVLQAENVVNMFSKLE